MNLNQLQYCITLAKYEHYTKAADELAITQPGLSNAIKLMEEELGTCLLEESTGEVDLHEARGGADVKVGTAKEVQKVREDKAR